MQNIQLTEIHKETLKSFNSKEIYDCPCVETLQKYITISKHKNTQQNTHLWFSKFEKFVKSTQPDIDLLIHYDKNVIAVFYQKLFKAKESFNIYEDYEFKAVCDTLYTRMIELEKINNGDYNRADPLTDEEMIQIFKHSN
ncbi:15307_t:CDS:2, partial [Funneliformis geosporum]